MCVLWWKNRAVGSDTVEMTGQSDVSDSHGTAGTVERVSGGKVLRFHSESVVWVLYVLCHLSFIFQMKIRVAEDLWI